MFSTIVRQRNTLFIIPIMDGYSDRHKQSKISISNRLFHRSSCMSIRVRFATTSSISAQCRPLQSMRWSTCGRNLVVSAWSMLRLVSFEVVKLSHIQCRPQFTCTHQQFETFVSLSKSNSASQYRNKRSRAS